MLCFPCRTGRGCFWQRGVRERLCVSVWRGSNLGKASSRMRHRWGCVCFCSAEKKGLPSVLPNGCVHGITGFRFVAVAMDISTAMGKRIASFLRIFALYVPISFLYAWAFLCRNAGSRNTCICFPRSAWLRDSVARLTCGRARHSVLPRLFQGWGWNGLGAWQESRGG